MSFQNISTKSIDCDRHLKCKEIVKETIDFKCLKEEEYSAINETIQAKIVGAQRDNTWLPSYSASYIESANDIFVNGDLLKPRLPYFQTLIFPGEGPLRHPDCPIFWKSS